MDYRNYRGEGFKIPPKLRRFLHYLRPAGIVFIIAGLAIPFLTVIKAIKSTMFSNLLDWILLVLGPACYLVGLSFDTFADRSQ